MGNDKSLHLLVILLNRNKNKFFVFEQKKHFLEDEIIKQRRREVYQ